jgi:reductive dehalogenase
MALGRTGSTRLEFALYTAAWTVGTTLGNMNGTIGAAHRGLYAIRPLPSSFLSYNALFNELEPWRPTDLTPAQVAELVKRAGRFYGATLVGVAELDQRWVYSRSFGNAMTNVAEPIGRHAPIVFEDVAKPIEREDGTLVIPKTMNRVVVMAMETDDAAIATAHSVIQCAGIGLGYSKMAILAGTMAEFIRGLGYQAVPCGNNTALSIPLAIDAGLGELGRNGLLITPRLGPRLRLAKVFTDMPLAPDRPISFGVAEFCEECGKCAKHCPGRAIPSGRNARTYEVPNDSGNPGVWKWPVDAEKCYSVWTRTGYDCAACIRSCPFNKPDTWIHRRARTLIGARSAPLNRALEWFDDVLGYGRRKPASHFWQMPSGGTSGSTATDARSSTAEARAPVANPAEVFDQVRATLTREPARLRNLTTSYQFEVIGDGGGLWFLRVEDERFELGSGEVPEAACRVTLAAEDLVGLANGTLNGPRALVTGRLKVKGQISLAIRLDRILG